MEQGIEPALRAVGDGADSTLLAMVLGCAVVNTLAFPILLRLWGAFFKQILHPRADMMQGAERTFSERFVLFLSLVQAVMFEGLILFRATPDIPAGHSAGAFCGLALLAAAMMAVQLGGYLAVGYAFAAPGEARPWMRSFFLSQSRLGYLLVIPAFGALFYPQYSSAFLIAAAVFYVVCRILFYIKGFAFFYTSAASLFYFFLYLCTLEIVPLVVVASLTGVFSTLFC